MLFRSSAELPSAPSAPPPTPPAHPALTARSSTADGPTAPLASPTALLAHLELPADSVPAIHPALLAAFREKPPASLKDVAAIYTRVFTAAEKAASPSSGASGPAAPAPDPLSTFATAPDSPTSLSFADAAKIIKRQIDDKTSGLRREVEALNWTEPGAPLRAMSLVDKAKPHDSPVLLRGNAANKGPDAPRRFLEILSPPAAAPLPSLQPAPFNPQLFHATTTSGRLELARAIASPTNPLTARVFVNRVWGWHFGPALVRTPSDFGVRTAAPVQRDLLDTLAASFIADGWSVKKLHRTILLSATYRQSSDESPAAAAADPDNQLLHRFNRRRLEFEALRDTLLAASGQLDLTPGGLPDDLVKEPFTHRRTVYGFIDRQNLPGLFRTFDFPNPDTSSAQRFATTVPQQALFLMNSPFIQEQARRLAQRPELASAPSDAGKIRALYATLYQRTPDAGELALAQTFLTTSAASTSRAKLLAAATPAGAAPGWHYGFGAFDAARNRVHDFTAMTVRKAAEGKKKDQDARLSPSGKFPDPAFGHLSLTPTGGHPGNTPAHASIRRWIAPADGVVQIDATLAHPADPEIGRAHV